MNNTTASAVFRTAGHDYELTGNMTYPNEYEVRCKKCGAINGTRYRDILFVWNDDWSCPVAYAELKEKLEGRDD